MFNVVIFLFFLHQTAAAELEYVKSN